MTGETIHRMAFLDLLWRIPREEKMMLEAFGEEYKTHMQHTGWMFPRISH